MLQFAFTPLRRCWDASRAASVDSNIDLNESKSVPVDKWVKNDSDSLLVETRVKVRKNNNWLYTEENLMNISKSYKLEILIHFHVKETNYLSVSQTPQQINGFIVYFVESIILCSEH